MERELVKEHVGRKASRRVGIGGQRRHAGAVFRHNFKGLDHGIVGKAEIIGKRLETDIHGAQVKFQAFLHRLPRLPFPAGKNHPAGPASGNFHVNEVFRDFQCRREGLARLPGEHADLETAFVVQPAALVRIQDGAHASPR